MDMMSNYYGRLRGELRMSEVAAARTRDSLEVEYVLADAEHAVGHFRVKLSGGPEARISEHWTIRDGKVVELRPFYWNPGTIVDAAASASRS
jgi:ketosteroid isomerase-like protein